MAGGSTPTKTGGGCYDDADERTIMVWIRGRSRVNGIDGEQNNICGIIEIKRMLEMFLGI